MTIFNNFDSATELCSYLTNTLIPDLRESGSDATADDFADCVAHIEALTPSETVTLHKLGTGEQNVNVRSLDIPDLWHIAHDQNGNDVAGALILKTWHIAHDLKNHILGTL